MSEAYRLKNQARQSADWLLDDDGTPLGLVGPNGDLLIPLLSQTNELTGNITKIAPVTQAQYDALSPVDAETLYVIVEAA